MTSTPDSIEGTIIIAVRWVKLGVEVFGAAAKEQQTVGVDDQPANAVAGR